MAEKIARQLAKPWALLGLAFFFGLLPSAVPVDVITYILSVMALTICQLVLSVQFADKDRDATRDCAMHKKLDAIIIALDKAPNTLVGIENQGTNETLTIEG